MALGKGLGGDDLVDVAAVRRVAVALGEASTRERLIDEVDLAVAGIEPDPAQEAAITVPLFLVFFNEEQAVEAEKPTQIIRRLRAVALQFHVRTARLMRVDADQPHRLDGAVDLDPDGVAVRHADQIYWNRGQRDVVRPERGSGAKRQLLAGEPVRVGVESGIGLRIQVKDRLCPNTAVIAGATGFTRYSQLGSRRLRRQNWSRRLALEGACVASCEEACKEQDCKHHDDPVAVLPVSHSVL